MKIINIILQVNSCAENEFKCMGNNHHCIRKELVCNGIKECRDGSDENANMCKV